MGVCLRGVYQLCEGRSQMKLHLHMHSCQETKVPFLAGIKQSVRRKRGSRLEGDGRSSNRIIAAVAHTRNRASPGPKRGKVFQPSGVEYLRHSLISSQHLLYSLRGKGHQKLDTGFYRDPIDGNQHLFL